MTFSLADFMGYCMSVISAIEDLNLSPGKHGKMTSFFCRKEITPPGRKFGDRLPDEVIIHALRPAGPLYLVFGCWAIIGGFFYARLCFCSLFELC